MIIDLENLIEEIRLWSERRDLTDDQIRSFVGMLEDDYRAEFYFPSNERQVELTTDVNGEVDIPVDLIKVKRMTALDTNGEQYTIYRKPNDVVVGGADWQGEESILYFERRLNKFIFAPNLGEGATVTLIYYRIIPSLVADNSLATTNTVLEIMPSVYLFGGLMMVHRFNYNEERAAYYERLYQSAKNDLVEMQEKAEMAGSRLAVFPTLGE